MQHLRDIRKFLQVRDLCQPSSCQLHTLVHLNNICIPLGNLKDRKIVRLFRNLKRLDILTFKGTCNAVRQLNNYK